MKISRIVIAVLVLFGGGHEISIAQSSGARTLLFQPSPVVNGMGGAGVALLHHSFEQYNNPGALGFGSAIDVSVSGQQTRPEFPGTPQYYLHISGGLDSTMRFGFAGNLIQRGTMYRVAENGAIVGSFKSSDIALTLSAARRFGPDFSCGVSISYYSSWLAPAIGFNGSAITAQSTMLSIGAVLKNIAPGLTLVDDTDSRANKRSTPYNQGTTVEPGICLGVCLSNLGTPLTIRTETASLPLNIRLGGTYTALRMRDVRALLAVDLDSRPLDGHVCNYVRAGFNIQFWRILSVRAGYAVSTNKSLESYVSLGVGLQYAFFRFSVAWYAPGIVPTASLGPTVSWE